MVAGSGNDELILGDAADATRVWTIDGAFGRGNIDNEFFFERFENLTGGNQADVFVFAGGSIDGTTDGGGGDDTLDYTVASGDIEVNRQTRTGNFIGEYENIEAVKGNASGNNTLVGADADANWNITGQNTGDIDGFDFENFQNLTGGDSNDVFTVSASGSITGKLRGTTTIGHVDDDKLDLAAKNESLDVDIQSTNAGIVSGGASVDFGSIENLVGGSASDQFVLQPLTGLNGTIDGGVGAEDHLDFEAWSSSVNVTLDGAVNAGESYGGFVTGVERLTGGSANDVLTGNDSANRIIGLGGSDTINGLTGDNVLIGDFAVFASGSIVTDARLNDGDDVISAAGGNNIALPGFCLLYTSPSPRDLSTSRMPSSA